ncbi:BZ3500_MvSof-1268-A1-R1_Chr4-1g06693 [Microbotryum saponariae]|uniref:BZ3500_MvSof-1268-A1-R1_Chr4-1g06693 protein n=1 Tax=Microbotryum saponariae TaxID=289078 RepID=A0A2X0MQZ7_9BASI|nr:BZ3500_MvSof-1268-A1-R1_Chr4-1g06693 [Microbotryum saponariae]SDA06358.1 BZ3501_MvSof-1269-A2-R1_Chr4-1g06403 [Microbotryum saponariae]
MKAGVSLARLLLLLHCSCCWASSREPHGTADSASVQVAPTAVEVQVDQADVARTFEPVTTINHTTAVLPTSTPPLAPFSTTIPPDPDAQTVATTPDDVHVSQEPVPHHATTADSSLPPSPTAGSSTPSTAPAVAQETPDVAATSSEKPAPTSPTTAANPTAPSVDPSSQSTTPPSADAPPVVSSATSSVTTTPNDETTASRIISTEGEATVSSSTSTTSSTTSTTATTAVASTTEEASSVPPIAAQTGVASDETVEAPEFLSFNEWKDKYVIVAADASAAAARRSKKTAQRARQDAQGGQASFDGDGADFGSLFASEEASGMGDNRAKDPGPGTSNGAAGPKTEERGSHKPRPVATGSGGKSDNALNVTLIQPLPNVGTGEASDPLLLLKDRSNYAAFECAAMVHRSSRQSKGASSILVEKKDRYMLTPCSADPKFVEVELCDEIQIDAIVLANFELFSSMFKYFEMTCSVDYPGRPETWHNLGTFRARNARGIQVFRPNPVPNFCRYVRINFLTHYGSEYYCPVSLLRVYGYTQLDAHRESERKKAELEAALASALEEGDAEEEEEEDMAPSQSVSELPASHEASASPAPDVDSATKQVENATMSDRDTASTKHLIPDGPPSATSGDKPTDAPSNTVSADTSENGKRLSGSVNKTEPTSTVDSAAVAASSAPTRGEPNSNGSTTESASASLDEITLQTPTSTPGTATSIDTQYSSSSADPIHPSPSVPAGPLQVSDANATEPTRPSTSEAFAASSTSEVNATTTTPSESANAMDPTASSPPAASTTASAPRPPASEPPIVTVRHAPRNETIRPMPPLPQITPPQPQPGESIYTTIMKRLTILEQNQTIAMHYIEAQSTMLREAFLRVERRLKDVEGMHQRQEQSFRLILSELDKQRLDIESERLSLTAQVAVLAQEVRLEKRLSIAELFGLLALVVFVVATRGSPTAPLMHLTSSQVLRRAAAQADARKVELARREGADQHRRFDAWEEMVTGTERDRERTRKASATRNAIAGLGRAPSGKRAPISSKTAPRRNYATTSASRTPVLRANRAWSPPVRHSSAPPDEIFPDFVINGDGPTTTRPLQRRGSRKSNGGYGSFGLGVFPNGIDTNQSARASSPLQYSTLRRRGSVELSDGMLSDDQFSTTTSASEPMHHPVGLYSAHATDEADDERGSRHSDDEAEETLLSPLPITNRPKTLIPTSPSPAAVSTSRASPPRKLGPPPSPRRHSSLLIPFPLVDDAPNPLAPTVGFSPSLADRTRWNSEGGPFVFLLLLPPLRDRALFASPSSQPMAPHAKGFSATRLYIGNLSPSVDEYTLMQLCSKHGKIQQLDYLFHKSGPLRGKPRGYAFVEFSTRDVRTAALLRLGGSLREALRAMVAMDDQLVRGRKISVTAASEQQTYDDATSSAGRGRGAGRASDPTRPTAISLLKSQSSGGGSTNKKIAALEAKLAALRKEKPKEGTTAKSKAGTSETKKVESSTAAVVDGDTFLGAIEKEMQVEPSEAGGKEGPSKTPSTLP